MAKKSHAIQTTEEQTTPVKSQELIDAENRVKEIRERERRDTVINQARADLEQYESEYERAKVIFFKVNSARRVLKNSVAL